MYFQKFSGGDIPGPPFQRGGAGRVGRERVRRDMIIGIGGKGLIEEKGREGTVRERVGRDSAMSWREGIEIG